ncbi:hypothetical protein AMTRI_Chr06g194380 [Amborella trichopoda]|uniref:Snurportin-1 n=1 Tax=Amborella trichopoda TaxID=13333 RepID=W1PPG1_AMBTC|nr:snurportin-1 isoform X2 [Amborella trichopoda]XP_020525469.1 snurportin-1 isoform X2 [Amborella trichopoda]ERN09958.1 hypothetical protein AMTR_s00013p00200700 [Amborella trichopoda]|eukprot:XP_011624903.1 snurportin-1 isoform X2 [Amborella trichopoda]
MAPMERQPLKRCRISDQQKRRELALRRQSVNRRDSQLHARRLASALLDNSPPPQETLTLISQPEIQQEEIEELVVEESGEVSSHKGIDVLEASKLRGSKARHWFSKQLMLPEWMIDVPSRLSHDWYVLPRPAGKRCLVVSSNGTTVSRLRNGSILHHFPSSLPNGARIKDIAGPAHMYCILDCIFHEPDQTYYVIDMICWKGYSLYDCSSEFRFFWVNSKLTETGACDTPSFYHKYRFSLVPVYHCDQMGLQAAYEGNSPFSKDGLLFYNKHAHYHTGITPLALVWKDMNCSQYFLDTDSNGVIPAQQQVVLELKEDGKVGSSDDPSVVFSCLDRDFLQQKNLQPGALLRFAIGDGGLNIFDGKLDMADTNYIGKANRARVSADSYNKVLFQYLARRSPLRIEDLVASINSSQDGMDVVMEG